ncbi:hypothetical protein SAMN05443634_102188 [Chishuiella changwenlii]|uniref:Uncharacterized protein n=1 Tax=Chishuiella changwenlii TaxID=1434701 RepID=A0A1M6U2Y5_9FLAO|nr:hypothetical protein [Chishuiella changwenlii]GGF08795.1 hypothetical protein GCM10010984_27410 [Chishuiella changwenlii]SHK63520.1 hypothetical protein SAMN05443634_102188 [Chishuiella changwenlii]
MFKTLSLIFTLLLSSIVVNAQTSFKIESFETSLVTKKMLYDWFGKWDNIAQTDDDDTALVWTNRKVINEANETFTLIASSSETEEGLYGSVIVLTSKSQDALAFDSPYKEYLNEFLKTIARKKSNSKRFFREYQKIK